MLASLSVVIPTYHEALNLRRLIERLAPLANQFQAFEVIIVDDDSQDDTKAVMAELQLQYPWLQLISRTQRRDLSLAVVTGLKQAKHDILLVMDADLSHSPEDIIHLVDALKEADFVIGSRFVKGGTIAEGWPWYRRLNAFIAKCLVKKLVRVEDPLSGFFCLRQSTFKQATQLNPLGYKIGLELMVKCRCKNIKELPIHFSEREHGESKLTLKQQLFYLRHLIRLYQYRYFK